MEYAPATACPQHGVRVLEYSTRTLDEIKMREAESSVGGISYSKKRLTLVAPFAKISLKSIAFRQRSPAVRLVHFVATDRIVFCLALDEQYCVREYKHFQHCCFLIFLNEPVRLRCPSFTTVPNAYAEEESYEYATANTRTRTSPRTGCLSRARHARQWTGALTIRRDFGCLSRAEANAL